MLLICAAARLAHFILCVYLKDKGRRQTVSMGLQRRNQAGHKKPDAGVLPLLDDDPEDVETAELDEFAVQCAVSAAFKTASLDLFEGEDHELLRDSVVAELLDGAGCRGSAEDLAMRLAYCFGDKIEMEDVECFCKALQREVCQKPLKRANLLYK